VTVRGDLAGRGRDTVTRARIAPSRTGGRAAEIELRASREDASTCTACGLYERATQTVFGEGSIGARLMLVGEQPGDREDQAGRPFVGPAGRVLTDALDQIGVSRHDVYVTNAVKHFKWTPRGKARIHKTPTAGEVTACHPWLESELTLVDPQVVVALGATATRAVLGRPGKVGELRGRALSFDGLPTVVVTIHPSAVLRADEGDDRRDLYEGLVSDLQLAVAAVG
jgi:DNA polymerase